MKRRKSTRRTRTGKYYRIVIRCMCAIFILTACAFMLPIEEFRVSAHESTDNTETYTYYKSIEIKPGDSLWSIAEETKPSDYASTSDYVDAIKSINGLSTDQIQAGSHLIISYESTDFISDDQ